MAELPLVVTLNSATTTRSDALPFITYYDEATGERTELSMTSLRNWQSKTANYLLDEIGISDGEQLAIDLPPHWVVPVWIGAARWVGAAATFGSPAECDSPTVTVIGPRQIDAATRGETVIGCSLLPFAQPFTKRPGHGIEDYFADVRIHADHYSGERSGPNPATAAAIKTRITQWGLVSGDRLLISGDRLSSDVALALYDVPLAISGSVVVVANSSPERLAKIADEERISRRLDT